MLLLFPDDDSIAPYRIWSSFASSHAPANLTLWLVVLSMIDLLQVESHHWWWRLWVPSNTSWVGIQGKHCELQASCSEYAIISNRNTLDWRDTGVQVITFIKFQSRGMTSLIIVEHLDRNKIQASTYLDQQEEDGYRKSLTKLQQYGSMKIRSRKCTRLELDIH
jgi:hypothetical protein